MDDPTPLEAEIRRLIAVAGPLPVAEYMKLCLTHPKYGYYTTHHPFGRAGDFVTAPEISQTFGELIGLWAGSVWRQMGAPEQVLIVECGPGRGTMMLDLLRAAQVVPGFRSAIAVHLVEISPALVELQRQTLQGLDISVARHSRLEDVSEGPIIILANEFFDALPVHQAVKREDGWHQRMVGLDAGERLAFTVAPEPLPRFADTLPPAVREAGLGAIFEWRSDHAVFELARRVVRSEGAALIVDYGHGQSECGDTLQAVSRHAFADPLAAPGTIDLTAHVDFQALAAAAESMGASAQGPIAQRDFLLRLGIDRRAAALKAKATLDQAAVIDSAVERLISPRADGMGRLFKAIGLAHPKLGQLPGFER